jgi:hypothetical protein
MKDLFLRFVLSSDGQLFLFGYLIVNISLICGARFCKQIPSHYSIYNFFKAQLATVNTIFLGLFTLYLFGIIELIV